MNIILKYWELIPTYGLPIFFFVWAALDSTLWGTIALLAFATFSLWASYLWLLIAAIRWEDKWVLLWFVPPVFLGMYIAIMVLL